MKHSPRSGFSILELSVVLTVISLIIGSALAIGATRIQAAKIEDTETKLKAISDMLDSFVQNYGYIPCPANPQSTLTDSDFGVGSVDMASGNCTAANLLGGSNNYRIGVVPVVTMNLTPSVMMDGWNRRITYAIDTRLNTPTKYAATNPDSGGAPYLKVESTSGTVVTDKAVVVFLSYGADGHGAWRSKGGASTIVADPVPTDPDALENVNGDNVFVQKFRTSTFDDIVYYRVKWQFPAVNP